MKTKKNDFIDYCSQFTALSSSEHYRKAIMDIWNQLHEQSEKAIEKNDHKESLRLAEMFMAFGEMVHAGNCLYDLSEQLLMTDTGAIGQLFRELTRPVASADEPLSAPLKKDSN